MEKQDHEPDIIPTKKYESIENKPHRELYNKVWDDIWGARKDLKTRHKVLYVILAFTGLNLCWFGLWTLMRSIPFLGNPLIAMPIGVLLLVLTGKVKDLA